ncbi:MAG TPA: ferritin-like domain-containing protein [Gemmataceae bacterium]|jgi:bacterioferritin|nr:ferritin-like domain-containing protein [Gemmataceae bacterium]
MAGKKEQILAALQKGYNMEVETVVNYLSISLDMEGVRADFIKQALAADIQGELSHAQQLGNRIKQLGGNVPGSTTLKMTQSYLQPPSDTTDVVTVIRGVIAAEDAAIEHYRMLAKLTDGEDYVTQELVIRIMSDEEGHRQTFHGYLKEYAKS